MLTTSRHIWRIFQQPPTYHPMFKRMKTADGVPFAQQNTRTVVSLSGAFILAITGVLVSVHGVTNPQDYIGGVLIALLILVTVVPLSGTAPGTLWTLRIVSELKHLRKSQLYDVLATTPGGGVKAAWALSLGIVLRSPMFENLYEQRRITFTTRSLMVLALFVVVALLFEESRQIFLPMLALGALIAGIYLDHFHSIILALLVSIAVGMKLPTEQDARTLGVASFLALQLLAYATSVVLLVILAGWLNLAPWWGYGLPQLALFYLPREVMIAGLWHYLKQQRLAMNEDDHADFTTVARPAKPE